MQARRCDSCQAMFGKAADYRFSIISVRFPIGQASWRWNSVSRCSRQASRRRKELAAGGAGAVRDGLGQRDAAAGLTGTGFRLVAARLLPMVQHSMSATQAEPPGRQGGYGAAGSGRGRDLGRRAQPPAWHLAVQPVPRPGPACAEGLVTTREATTVHYCIASERVCTILQTLHGMFCAGPD
jgi:hypothetical protein